MNKKPPSAEQAQDAINALHESQQNLLVEFMPPLWVRLIMSMSFGAIIFGYGMTEHENNWALAMWGGAIVFVLSTLLYCYIYRLQGIKIGLLPRSEESKKINAYSAIGFSVLCFGSRFLKADVDIAIAPYICSIAAASILFYLQRKYPTGEVEVEKT